jgi:hypothetical protein
MRMLYVAWLRLRHELTKKAAHAELAKRHPDAPSIARLDRWWNAQNKAMRDSIFDIAEGRTYQRVAGEVSITRRGPDLTKVRADMKRGAKRVPF